MRLKHTLLALLLTLATVPIAVASADDGAHRESGYDHIFVIVEENTEFSDVIGNTKQFPTLNNLAGRFGLATNYYGTIHPSEGNYVSLVGGDDYGIQDDAPYQTHQISQASIVDQLERAGLTWRGYFQNLPVAGFTGNCYPDATACLYASKHNGFVNFMHVSSSPAEMANLVPDTNLVDDLETGNVPNFAFIAPDQCHDEHGQSVCPDPQLSQGTDAYLKSTVEGIMRSDFWPRGQNAIVITFDEGSTNLGCCDGGDDPTTSGGGRVATIVIRNHDARPMRDPTPYNHHSLVATLQVAFGLGCRFNGQPVGDTCDRQSGVKPMRPLFGLEASD
ncbi:MAG: phosphoesterase [Chloroflexi bacterium]|nr:phosphoesterase [Chloroflexota bacterium]